MQSRREKTWAFKIIVRYFKKNSLRLARHAEGTPLACVSALKIRPFFSGLLTYFVTKITYAYSSLEIIWDFTRERQPPDVDFKFPYFIKSAILILEKSHSTSHTMWPASRFVPYPHPFSCSRCILFASRKLALPCHRTFHFFRI